MILVASRSLPSAEMSSEAEAEADNSYDICRSLAQRRGAVTHRAHIWCESCYDGTTPLLTLHAFPEL